MTTDRFYSFMTAMTLASGLLFSTAPVLADGGGSDRDAMQAGVETQSQPVSAASADTNGVLSPAASRRPLDKGAAYTSFRDDTLSLQVPTAMASLGTGEAPPPRGKSRLNHIIGDNADAANNLRPLISKYATANGIPYRLADAVVRVESRYNPQARNGPYMGLMQIHPKTAASLGYGGDARGLLEASTNLQYGVKYLAMAYRLAGGDTCGTVMRYQGGHRSVRMTAANHVYCNKVKMILAESHN